MRSEFYLTDKEQALRDYAPCDGVERQGRLWEEHDID